jgi:4-hydroxybenzoate polyprenyltransferase
LRIARIDHWFKNVVVFPGITAAIGVDPSGSRVGIWSRTLIGLASVCLVAYSNYVINEVLDAPSDLAHSVKRNRPTSFGWFGGYFMAIKR